MPAATRDCPPSCSASNGGSSTPSWSPPTPIRPLPRPGAEWVDGSLRTMPQHLRLGVAGESPCSSAAWSTVAPSDDLAAAATARPQPDRCPAPVRPAVPVARALRRAGAGRRRHDRSRHRGPRHRLRRRRRTTAAMLAEAGRGVLVVEEGPWVDPDAVEPVLARGDGGASTATRARRRRSAPAHRLRRGPVRRRQHRDQQRALAPPAADLAEEWRPHPSTSSTRRGPRPLRRPSWRVAVGRGTPVAPPPVVGRCSSGAPPSSAGVTSSSPASSATTTAGRAVKQTMARTLIPRAVAPGAGR